MKSKRPLGNQSNMQNKNFMLSESLVNKLSKLLSQASSAQCHKKKHRKKKSTDRCSDPIVLLGT